MHWFSIAIGGALGAMEQFSLLIVRVVDHAGWSTIVVLDNQILNVVMVD